ncbi:MAG: DUF815 domain-containing protein, partial [Candidatus Eiseniibacteriota bacterium]
MNDQPIEPLLRRIADALERLAPGAPRAADLGAAEAFIWHADGNGWLEPLEHVNRVDLDLLRGIDRQRDTLLDNTRRFAK